MAATRKYNPSDCRHISSFKWYIYSNNRLPSMSLMQKRLDCAFQSSQCQFWLWIENQANLEVPVMDPTMEPIYMVDRCWWYHSCGSNSVPARLFWVVLFSGNSAGDLVTVQWNQLIVTSLTLWSASLGASSFDRTAESNSCSTVFYHTFQLLFCTVLSEQGTRNCYKQLTFIDGTVKAGWKAANSIRFWQLSPRWPAKNSAHLILRVWIENSGARFGSETHLFFFICISFNQV